MPERQIISNTSPLLYLHQIQQIDLLAKIYHRFLVPPAVEKELQEGARLGVDVPDLDIPWLEITPIGDFETPKRVSRLGAGEAEAITLGLQFREVLLLLDDRAGRREASALGLQSIGTLGVLVNAKRAGLVPAFRPLLERLMQTTLWLGDDVVAEALRLADEF